MTNCYICDTPLTLENSSKEHILLNSIGGHLKSKDLLCNICNSKFGHEADTELANQLLFLSSYLNVKRDSGKNQIIKGAKTEDGREYHIDGDRPIHSKPNFKKKVEGGETKYLISARTEKELLNILKGLRKKHPELDLEVAKQKFQWKEEYLNEHLSNEITIGGDLAFISIVKTAVDYYILTANEKEQVKHLFEYLKGNEKLNIIKHYYPTKPIYKKDTNEIVHLIHLRGNKYSKLLFCFIEFFSSYSFLIILSDKYEGKNISSTYCYDVLKSQVVEKQVKLKLEKEAINITSKICQNDFTTITNKLSRVLDIANKIKSDKEISNIIQKTINKVFYQYKNETKFTEQMIHELSKEISLAYVKFAFRGKRKTQTLDEW